MSLAVLKRKKRIKNNMDTIRSLYRGVQKVYGPYNNSSDGRYRVVLYDGKNRITRQYAKLKMEIKLGYRLGEDDTVAHLDDNFHNDRYSNLAVIPRADHANLDAVRRKVTKAPCCQCGKVFTLTRYQIGNTGKAGPFCSRKCSGAYGKQIHAGVKRRKRKVVKAEYYKLSGNRVTTH